MSPRAAPAAPQRACRALPSQLCHALSAEAPPMALTCNGGGRGGANGSRSPAKSVRWLPAELPRVGAAAMQLRHDAQCSVVRNADRFGAEYRVMNCMRAEFPRVARVFRMLGIPSLNRVL